MNIIARLPVVSLVAAVSVGPVLSPTQAAGTAAAARGERPAAATSAATPPTVRIDLSKRAIVSTKNTFDFRPGLIRVEVSGKSNCPVWFVRLDRGYSFREFKRDQYAAFYNDADARERLFKKSDYAGGLVGRVDETVRGTLTLPKAGRYVIAGFSDRLTRPIRFELSGPSQQRDAAEYDHTIIATSEGWAGDLELPTTGTLRFKNEDSDPHTLWLQPVPEGTTAEEVRQWLEDNPDPDPEVAPPWWADGPRLAMMPIDPGASETRDYANYAPGTYLAWEVLGWELEYPPTMLGIVQMSD